MGVPGVKGTHSGLDRGAGVNLEHIENTDHGLFKPSSFHPHLSEPGNKTNCVSKDFGPLLGKLEFHLNLRGGHTCMLSIKYFDC